MTSPTQRQLTDDEVKAYARQAFPEVTVTGCKPLSGGTFAAVWRVGLSDGRDTVLKAGPSPQTPLLTYEADMIESEAAYYRLVRSHLPDAPVPTVLYGDKDFLFVTYLPGAPLSDQDDDSRVREQTGAVLSRIHNIKGPLFGYPTSTRPQAETWSKAFQGMVDALLDDAVRWKVPLPQSAGVIRAVVNQSRAVLDEVTEPRLVHFDLWDGNVLCQNGKLTGLVDGERYFFGDPLFDFVSTALFQKIEDQPEHPFLRGYGPVVLHRRRLALYRMYLYLLMHVEVPSRGITEEQRIRYVAQLLDAEISWLASG